LVKGDDNSPLWFIDGPNQKTYDEGLNEVFHGNIQKAVSAYYKQICEMVATQKPDIVGHLDKIQMHNKGQFFNETENWYKKVVSKTLKVIKECGSIIEVNTRGIYKKRSQSLFPSIAILKEIYQMDIPITISSDAHMPNEMNLYFEETFDIIKSIGFKSIKIFNGNDWTSSLL
jgi:histidinol-phosphatase (PHP family)